VKRLIDEEFASGSPEGLLADLVRATPPAEPAPFDRARILARIHGAKPARRGLTLRAGLVVLLLAGAAAATVAAEHAWTARRGIGAANVVAPRVAPKPPAVAAKDEAAVRVAAPEPEVARAAISATPVPLEAPLPEAPRGDAPKARPASRPVLAVAPVAAKDGEDPAPVLEAIHALRSEGDVARAGALLADYLRAHPRSVLAEDALALSIESALARHDARAASDLAKRYLTQYPNGRYRAYAQRADNP